MKNKGLRFQLLVLSSMLLMVSVLVGIISYWTCKNTVAEYSVIVTENLPKTQSMYEVMMQSRQARLFIFQLAMPGISKQRADEIIAELPPIWQKFEEAKKAFAKIPFGAREEEHWNNLTRPLDKIKDLADRVVELYKKNPAEDSAERKEMIKIITQDMDELNKEARAAGQEMRKYEKEDSQKDAEAALTTARQGNYYAISIIFIGFILGFIFSISFSNYLVKVLTGISNSLSGAGFQVGAGATQIAATSQELSQATTEQAASLEQTAASIEEMNNVITKNTDSAQNSAEISKKSRLSAIRGKETVEAMITSMNDIDSANNKIVVQVNQSNIQMEEIVRVIKEIGNKTKVINDIVFQTKLLSFNASVEAARAGELGKGFAVVAEEVGSLAQMSGNAAQDISSMLEESIRKVESIANESSTSIARMAEEGKQKVEIGTKIAYECGQVLEEIVVEIENVSLKSEEIAKASLEQMQGIHEITKAMHSLDQATQQNSSATEQASSAAEQLSAQAEALNLIVRQLSVAVYGVHSNASEGGSEKVANYFNNVDLYNRKAPISRAM